MTHYLVLFLMFLAASLVSAEKCSSSPGSSSELSLSSVKNSTGHWIITVDTRRSTLAENQRQFTLNVQQETRLCGSSEIEQLVSMTSVYPSLNDLSMPTATSAASSIAISITTATSSTPTATTPKSCSQSGYQQFPGFNCYKMFSSEGEHKNWTDAREVCRRDGGDLLVMETVRERDDVFIPLRNTTRLTYNPWTGVYFPQGIESWVSVTGEPVPSSWWRPDQPENNTARMCAPADFRGLLENWDCTAHRAFICEIPL